VSVHGAPPEILSVRQSLPPEMEQRVLHGVVAAGEASASVPVGRYEKFEVRVELAATYQNPFDPDEIDLSADFTAPSGRTWHVWGFFNPSNTTTLWMIRFTPCEMGRWRYVVHVRDRQGAAASKPAEFTVRESAHHGFIRVANNRRYLQYTDGTPFYGIGLWYNDAYELHDQGAITEAELDRLKLHGLNFISFYNTPLETMATGVGRYDSGRAGRLDQIFAWCEARDISISWNFWFHAYLSRTVWSGNNRRFQHNPYQTVTSAEGFFTSPEAWRYATRLHRYMMARWGYSRALFLWHIIDEADGTDGWVAGGEQGVNEWAAKVHAWFKANDPYERPTTGTRCGSRGARWTSGNQIFDLAAIEIYEAHGFALPPGGKPDLVKAHPLQYSIRNYATEAQWLWQGFRRPSIIAETGGLHTYYEPGSAGYTEIYHSALWTSLANGVCATPFWWAYLPSLADAVPSRAMTSFSLFVRDIDFSGREWKPVTLEMSHGDGWAMHSDNMTFGWAANPGGGIANETLTVPVLPDGDYDVHFFHTWRGTYLPVLTAGSAAGRLRVTVPELTVLNNRANHIGADIAFKIVRRGAPR